MFSVPLNSSQPFDWNSIFEPLPPPPLGSFWERNETGNWEIKPYNYEVMKKPEDVVFDKPVIIEHVVMSTDTLSGLCLRYRVTALTLRRWNTFSGNNIQCLNKIRIPIEPGIPINLQQDTHDVMLQQFRNQTGEGTVEARFYLEGSKWSLQDALSKWKGDENWTSVEAKQHPPTQSAPKFSEELPVFVEGVVVTGAVLGINQVRPAVIQYHSPNVEEPPSLGYISPIPLLPPSTSSPAELSSPPFPSSNISSHWECDGSGLWPRTQHLNNLHP